MKTPIPALATAALAALLLAAAGCGDDDPGGADGARVSATTGVVTDIAEQVAGSDAEVVQVIPDSASPHDFSLSARDRGALDDSALVVANGAGLEAGLPLDEVPVPVFQLSEHAGELLPFEAAGHDKGGADGEDEAHDEEGRDHGEEGHAEGEEEEHAEGEEEHAEGEEEHDHGGVDPHLWMDPTRVAAALPALADALAEADPDHAAGYRERAAAYAEELRALDRELARTLAGIPASERKLVTSHEALGYFADRYDLELVGAAFPASGPEAEPSAASIRDLEEQIRAAGVPAVFSAATDDAEVLRRIAEAAGVELVDELLVESPGEAGSYVEMLRRDAELLRRALGD